MRFRAPEYYDSNSESESESESTPAASSAHPTPPTADSTSNARTRELHILTKKGQAKHKRRGKDGKIGMRRFDVYRDAYLARRRRGRHGQGPGQGPGPSELGRETERKSGAFSRESTAEAAVKIENPLACGLERVFDDFVRHLARGSGSGSGSGGAANGSPSARSCIAPGAFPGLSMIDSDND